MRFEFEVMPPMDRPAHRWDECCSRWRRHDWEMRVGLFRLAPWSGYWAHHWWPFLVRPLLTGVCEWHGKA